MPKTWVYIFALLLPLGFSLLLLHSPMALWFWNNGYQGTYYFLRFFMYSPTFINYLGGWAFPIFVATMIGYWMIESEDESVASQFLLTPLIFVPFSIAITMIANMQFDGTLFYKHPLVIIPLGYIYVILWVVLIWLLEKIKLVN